MGPATTRANISLLKLLKNLSFLRTEISTKFTFSFAFTAHSLNELPPLVSQPPPLDVVTTLESLLVAAARCRYYFMNFIDFVLQDMRVQFQRRTANGDNS